MSLVNGSRITVREDCSLRYPCFRCMTNRSTSCALAAREPCACESLAGRFAGHPSTPLAAVHHCVHCRPFCRHAGAISGAMYGMARCEGPNGAASTLQGKMYRPLTARLSTVHSRVHCRVLCRDKCPAGRAKRAAMCARVYGRAAEPQTSAWARDGAPGAAAPTAREMPGAVEAERSRRCDEPERLVRPSTAGESMMANRTVRNGIRI